MQRTCWHVLAGLIALILLCFAGCAFAEEQDTIIEQVWVLCYPDSEVNIRERPTKKSFAFGAMSCGNVAWTDNKTRNGYLHLVDLAAEVTDGWISKKYIVYEEPEVISAEATISSDGRVACRKWIKGKIKGWIKNGEKLIVYAMTSEWATTSRGYISSQYLILMDDNRTGEMRMERLKIETARYGMGVNVQKITGFTEQEIKELGSMEQSELEETVLDMLDRRNGNTGTCWKCGYGVCRTWMHGDAVYMEVGSSCD